MPVRGCVGNSSRCGAENDREREQLTVPAGTFEALRVEYTGPEGIRRRSNHWYVDGIGEVKRADWDGSEQLLKSFTRGEQPGK
jgi:hypothetical protein